MLYAYEKHAIAITRVGIMNRGKCKFRLLEKPICRCFAARQFFKKGNGILKLIQNI